MENATLTNIAGFQAHRTRPDLDHQPLGPGTDDDGVEDARGQIAEGTAKVDGDATLLGKLAAAMVDFDPRFEIMPGTKALTEVAHADPYQAVPERIIAE